MPLPDIRAHVTAANQKHLLTAIDYLGHYERRGEADLLRATPGCSTCLMCGRRGNSKTGHPGWSEVESARTPRRAGIGPSFIIHKAGGTNRLYRSAAC